MPKCGQCGVDSPKRKDRYCAECRKAYNAKRAVDPNIKKKRADAYYWNVTVPQLRAKLNERYPLKDRKVGAYYSRPVSEFPQEYGEIVYRHESWESYQRRLNTVWE
jgi:hypothetical protein